MIREFKEPAGPRNIKPIYKLDLAGNVVLKYLSTAECYKKEHVGYIAMLNAIRTGTELNGHYFSYAERVGRQKKSRAPVAESREGLAPWESTRGTFDVKGWAKVCL